MTNPIDLRVELVARSYAAEDWDRIAEPQRVIWRDEAAALLAQLDEMQGDAAANICDDIAKSQRKKGMIGQSNGAAKCAAAIRAGQPADVGAK